ncbi:MAG: UDP-N-acetylmuramoyl-L-alanyl-D-glutamate--2,6-diaminopimelate ligase [Sedimenticola sp.]
MMTGESKTGVMLGELLSGWLVVPERENCWIKSITQDSRTVRQGSLFLACSGGSHHGLDFFNQAVDAGAVAVVCEPALEWPLERIEMLTESLEIPLLVVDGLGIKLSALAGRFYHHPSQSMTVVGVTGTNGKTSCAQFLARALSDDRPCGVIGTLGNGFPDSMEDATHTTPDPVLLQALLHALYAQGAKAVAMEVSSHALDQSRVAHLNFDVAVLTNLSRDHLDYHGTLAAYGEAKKQLFYMPGLGCAVINLDDPFGRELLNELPTDIKRVGYGIGSAVAEGADVDCWVQAPAIDSSSEGMRITIGGSWGEGTLNTPLLGHFNVSNLLAVLAVLLHLDIPLNEALERLAKLRTVPGRVERFGGGDRPLVVVDYAHTPNALEHVLMALRGHTEQRLICLFGCGGDRDRGKRPLMGRVAERLADRVIVTDDNPRGENGDRIVEEILAGMELPEQVQVIRNRKQSIAQAIAEAEVGDLVLVAGKGHETVQIVGSEKHPFSDCEQVVAALSEVRG